MKVAVLGTGIVGQTIGSKLVQLGHEVMMGSRDADNPKAVMWAKEESNSHAMFGTFANAASFGEIIFNCTLGAGSLNALQQAGAQNMKGKIIIDTSNPLDYTNDIWTLTVCNDDSLGEQIQRAFPESMVVKSLNTMNCDVMVDPGKLGEKTTVFLSGNSADAKATVHKLLHDWFGWRSVIDLGDITASRGVEMYALVWRNLRQATASQLFNIKVVTA